MLAPEATRHTPVLASGDLGAGGALAHLALAAYASRHNLDGRAQLLLSSSDDDLRGALRLSSPNPPGTL